MNSIWNLIRSLLYSLSKIPGLGFLYQADRWLSHGESVRSSVKSFKAERDLEKEKNGNNSNPDDNQYEETTEGVISPFRQMAKTAAQTDPDAEETKSIQSMVSEMDDMKKEYSGDTQGFFAAFQENEYAQKIPQLLAVLQTKNSQQ